MNDREKRLVGDFMALLLKHDCALKSTDEYDGEDNYAGTTYYIANRVDGPSPVYLQMSDLERATHATITQARNRKNQARPRK